MAVPPATPVTTPVVGLTLAMDALLLLHVPPVEEFVKYKTDVHIGLLPDMDEGDALTLTVVVAALPQPLL